MKNGLQAHLRRGVQGRFDADNRNHGVLPKVTTTRGCDTRGRREALSMTVWIAMLDAVPHVHTIGGPAWCSCHAMVFPDKHLLLPPRALGGVF